MAKIFFRKCVGQICCRALNFITMWRKFLMAIAIERGWVQSDRSRWGKLSSLFSQWDERTKEIATLIPEGSNVLEFGAGRMTLKQLLPRDCKYTPSDIVDRGEGTLICDLNAPELPSFPPHDIAVFGGVLEYVVDVPRLVSCLTKPFPVVIVTYCIADGRSVVEKLQRRSKGWSNDYLEEEIEDVFSSVGYRLDYKQVWRTAVIYRFVTLNE